MALLIRFFLPVVVLVSASSAKASFVADVAFDFVQGWISIKPTPVQVNSGYVCSFKSSGWGLSLGPRCPGASSGSDWTQDSYLYLKGNPDALSFRMIQFMCDPQKPEALGAVVTGWSFDVPQGQLGVKGIFVTGEDIMARLGEKPCTPAYRQANARSNLKALSLETIRTADGHFQVGFGRGVATVNWNARDWKDALTKDAERALEKADEVLK